MGVRGGFGAEGEFPAEDLTGEVSLLLSAGDFAGGRLMGDEGEGQARPVGLDTDVLDELQVAAVEGVGEAQEGGEMADDVASGAGEGLEIDMLGTGQGLAVVACDHGHEVDLRGGEMPPGLAADEAGGVLVMRGAAAADRPADVMEQGGAVEEEAFLRAEAVEVGELVEESEGEAGDVGAMLRFRFEPVHGLLQFLAGGVGIQGQSVSSRRAA